MKFSIITPCLNSAATIESTIKSVTTQQGVDFEYIIVDGGSNDDTLKIINNYKDKITKIISEPDRGIYDAMNKGIAVASGEVIGIINSDDCYFDTNTLKLVELELQKSDSDALYGDLIYVSKYDTNKVVRRWRAGSFNEKQLSSGWIPPHPTCFIKHGIYDKYGLFRSDLQIAADYELLFRFFKKGVKFIYLQKTLVKMREGGKSAGSFGQRWQGWQELKKAWQLNGFCSPRWFILRRVLSKISQYFIK